MRRYHRPLIVTFSSLALASLFSYAAITLTDSTPKTGPVAASTPEPSEEARQAEARKSFANIVAKSEAGDVDAMFERAMSCLVGLGTTIDRPAAAKWLRQAAEKGHTQALFSYGQALQRGELYPKDPKEAHRWFRLSAEKGNADAELSLAQAYNQGLGVEVDEKEALRWLGRSAGHGHPIAQFEYGMSLFDDAKPDTMAESAEWMRKSALQGYPKAMFSLGVLYLKGHGVRRDRTNACAWFMVADLDGDEEIHEQVAKALEQASPAERKQAVARANEIVDKVVVAPMLSLGSRSIKRSEDFHRCHAQALAGGAEDQYALAKHYHEGIGTVKDPAEAAVWCRKAAEQGHVYAMRTLGHSYRDGDGVPRDLAEMTKWYRRAAEQNDPQAQFMLGVCYMEGTGVEKDPKQAEVWTKKAADQGHAIAQANMGSFIMYSRDSSRLPEAARWFKLSAKQGHPPGMFKLGFLLFMGYGIPEDRIEGGAWMLACLPRTEDDSLKQAVKDVVSKLTPEERRKAEASALEIQKTL